MCSECSITIYCFDKKGKFRGFILKLNEKTNVRNQKSILNWYKYCTVYASFLVMIDNNLQYSKFHVYHHLSEVKSSIKINMEILLYNMHKIKFVILTKRDLTSK